MSRKRLLASLSVYLLSASVAALLVGSQGERLTLSMPAGLAVFWLGCLLGGAAVVSLLIWNLRQQQRRLLAEKRQLEAATAGQAAIIEEQATTISSQAAALQQSQHAVGEQQDFRSALNHELRNPVTAIKTGLELLDDGEAGTVARLKTDIDRVAHLLETVNRLSRLETDPIEQMPVQLDELVQQAAEMIQATPAGQGCGWVMDFPRDPFPLPPVPGDEDLLFILVHNLLNNAVKFSVENCEVIVRAFADNQSVVLQVCDNGIGMSEADQAHLGKAFYRGQTALDHRIGGSGLGLYQVAKIVARHGGQFSCQSMVGKGTVMTVRLPLNGVTAA